MKFSKLEAHKDFVPYQDTIVFCDGELLHPKDYGLYEDYDIADLYKSATGRFYVELKKPDKVLVKDDIEDELLSMMNDSYRFKQLESKLQELFKTSDVLRQYHTNTQTTYQEYVMQGLTLLGLPTMDGGIYLIDYYLDWRE